MGLFNVFSKEIGIDLGTTNLRISDKNGTILINEPSIVALDINTYEIKAVGHEAKSMLGKTPENILCINPMEAGIIADFESARAMLTYFVKNAINTYSIFQPKAVMTFSSFLTDVEKRSLEDVCLYSGIREVEIVHKNVAASIGLDLDPLNASGHLIVSVGGGTIEASIIAMNGIVYTYCERIGGEYIDDTIRSIVKKAKKMSIGINTAEVIKCEIASLYNMDLMKEISGHDLVGRLPKYDSITAKDIYEPIQKVADATIHVIRKVLEFTPPEISSDIINEGIYLIGGLANIDGLANYIKKNIAIPINEVEDPMLVTANGIGKYLKKERDVKISI